MKNRLYFISTFFLLFFAFSISTTHAGYQVNTTATATGAQEWTAVASNSTGQYLGATAWNNYIYTSSNYGASWTQITAYGQRYWNGIASGGTGQYLAVGAYGYYIYTSSNYGASWTQRSGAGARNWGKIASSSTGQYFAAVASGDYIYTSSNYGVSWTQRTGSGSRSWKSIASSSNGQYLVAGVNSGYIYVSSDYGATWTEKTDPGSRQWYGAASNSTGQYQVVAALDGRIYTSSDYGVTWTIRRNLSSPGWYSVASDSTGQYLAAASSDYIYTSSDYGVTWIQETTPGSGSWSQIASSSTGQYQVAAKTNEYLYALEYTAQVSTYTISYNSNSATGGSVPSNQTKTHDVNLTLASNTGSLTRTGYTFAGWNTQADGNGTNYAEGATFSTNATTTLYAKWTANQYTISYDSNSATSGSVPSNQTKTHAVNLTLASNTGSLLRTGYTFAGWNTQADGNGTNYAEGANFTTNANTTLYAKWTPNQYTLTFDSDGGSVVSPITDDYNAAVISPVDPTKTGYTFAGWDPALPSNMPAGDQTHTALWTINQYTLTFDTDGGSGVAPIIDDYNTSIITPSDPTKTGYTFTGWSPSVPSNMPASDETYVAQWSINEYTLTFDSDGGTSVSPITQDYNTSVVAPTPPTKEGYTFGGWDPALPSNIPASDQTHTALWTIDEFTITFDSDGGTVVSAIIEDFGATIIEPTDPTKTGYTFTGWSPALPVTMPASNNIHTAQWQVNEYTLTFESDGGSAVSPITDDFGTAITPPTNPTKTGYTFTGWSPVLPGTIPAGDQTYTAQWDINQYTITFDTDGGSIVNAIIQDYDTAITPPANPTKPYYTFTGWSPSLPSSMPASNTSYTALWERNPTTRTTSVQGRIQNLVEIGNIERATELNTQYKPDFTALPTSIEGLKSLLVQLQTKLAQLLGQQTGAGTSSPATVSNVRDLELNDEGDDVRRMQQLLINQGYSISSGATGFFGLQTQSALIKFQQDNNIAPAAGYYGPRTRAVLK